MKTINLKKIFTVALLMLSVGFAFATNPVVYLVGENKLSFKLDYVTEDAKLIIKDLDGFSLFSEEIGKSDSKYLKTFDLSDLPNGSYIVEVENSFKVVSYSVSIVKGVVTMPEPGMEITYKPIVIERGNKVYVNKFNPEKAPLHVEIMDSNSEVVFSETLTGNTNLGRVYDFSKTKGEYVISMNCDEKEYTQTVSNKE